MIQMKINKNLIKYFKRHPGINFIKYFYGIFINKKDIKDFKEYSKVILHRTRGFSASQIAKLTKISKRKIDHWIYEGNKPFIIRILDHYLNLGKPKNNLKWLSINSTRGGLLIEPWIQVPEKIESYNDIYSVIKQLKVLQGKQIKTKKELCFAYLLGILIGDSSKTGIKRKQRVTRRIHLRLSKGYKTNERLGEFVKLCTNYLSMRMNRCKDCPAGKRNVYPFYTWISQSSLLIQWIFNVCLGLKNNELTTYNPIRADWILKSPREFKIFFLQGLADSDGFVDFSSQKVGIITEPNTGLIKNILKSLNISAKPWLITRTKLWTLMISIKDAYNLPTFNPTVKSYRYEQMEKLYKAKKISGKWPPWLIEKVEKNIKNGLKGTEIVKKILNEENIAIRTKNIHKRAKKLER